MVVEDGVRRVVINSRYPLYEVRKGDLWYQLETALREVCVTIPEATVPEFERQGERADARVAGPCRAPASYPPGAAPDGAPTLPL